ncbi:putative nudix hydrolase NudL [mine drainage metagenome]|uniref:Putative nudix hydrolase NudL n=1 Tax=mine drainage metagenome TaxID=410659 RepID=A0A1J5Q8Y3_9ZZZZ
MPKTKVPFFDPRQVPVVQVDAHLPAVSARELLPDSLRARFASPPVWTAELVAEKRFTDQSVKYAAVMIPIMMRRVPTVLLTQRAAHLSNHPGQIAFPGGKFDESEEGATATAQREAFEEVGLPQSFSEILGELPIYFTGSAFLVTPVIALVQPYFVPLANAQEVSEVFEVPLEFLMNPANHRHHVMQWQGVERRWLSMPYVDGSDERFIWGATAGMLRNLYRFLTA